MVKLLNIIMLLALLIAPLRVLSQEESALSGMKQLNSYYGKLQSYAKSSEEISSAEELDRLNRNLRILTLKWDNYYKLNEAMIGSNEELLNVVVEWEELSKRVSQRIEYKLGLVTAQEQVDSCMANMVSGTERYEEWVKEAISLSLSKSLAKPLEKLKGDEQVLLADLSSSNSNAQTLGATYAELKPQTDSLTVLFVAIQNNSQIIQAQEFKPLFVRIKDYLMGLAAVTMILMFINMLHTKLKAVQAEGKRLKDMKKMMSKKEEQYPTI